jgi:Protein of unknown function (DUF4127)
MIKNTYSVLQTLIFCLTLIFTAQAQTKFSTRILFVPLDDRPPTYQWILKMGEIGDAQIIAPPREMLGRFTEFGKSDEVIEWLKQQDLKSFDAAIIAVDMLAYGGLVAMREYKTDLKTAQKRLEFVREMKRRAPKLKIYASSVMMRLAPTGNVVNESYRETLAKWAEISVDENLKKQTAELEKKIPAEALQNYKLARQRDLQINLAAINLVRDKILEQLILGQDDAKPKGVHVADRERLIAEVKRIKLESKIGVQPGADELSMLQLARALGDKYNHRPKIKAIYSSETIKNQFMPYEDRPLHQTVSFQIASIGAVEVENAKDADILFYVYASRFEPGRAESFADEIKAGFINEKDGIGIPIRGAKSFIIADVDPKGDVQGADPKFTEALLVNLIFPRMDGYAAWNTAGNTVGTALPHGFVFNLAKKAFSFPLLSPIKVSQKERQRRNEIMNRVDRAQTWFMLNRLLDDYVYHSLVRPETIKTARAKDWNTLRLNIEQTAQTEDEAGKRVKAQAARILNYISPFSHRYSTDLVCDDLKSFSFKLPWNRTFEAELDFDLKCSK